METKRSTWIILGIICLVCVILPLSCYLTYRKEPAKIVSMTWELEKVIEESRDSYTTETDRNGYSHTRHRVYWYQVDRACTGGFRDEEPKWPVIRKPGYRERERRYSRFYILCNSKVDGKRMTYKGHSQQEFMRYDLNDEVLLGVSYGSTVWSIAPYRLE